jgi:proline dehydrogenase
MSRFKLSIKDALVIQAEQIEEWKTILNDETIKVLTEEAAKQNKVLMLVEDATGFDVWRGTDIDNFLANYKITKRTS